MMVTWLAPGYCNVSVTVLFDNHGNKYTFNETPLTLRTIWALVGYNVTLFVPSFLIANSCFGISASIAKCVDTGY